MQKKKPKTIFIYIDLLTTPAKQQNKTNKNKANQKKNNKQTNKKTTTKHQNTKTKTKIIIMLTDTRKENDFERQNFSDFLY